MDQPPQVEGYSQQTPYRNYGERPAEPKRPKSGCFGSVFWVLVLLGLIGSAGMNLILILALGVVGLGSLDDTHRVQEQHYSLNRFGNKKVAIISIEGTILSGEGFFRDQIEHARRDAEAGNLKAIVLRVNSPGGTIAGSDYMLHHLRDLSREKNLPLVVSMGGIAASGGYYVSMCVGDQPDTIFAEPTTWTGSIGVLIPHYNLAELMAKCGVSDDTISSGPLKTMGSMARPMTEEERKLFAALVNDSFEQFKEAIKSGRPKFRQDPAALDRLATGQIFTAKQAQESGLVDQIGFIEDAIDKAISLAGLLKSDVNVVRYKSRPSLSDVLFGGAQTRQSLDLAAMLESTTPRAYFLCTWLPAVAGSAK
jgi:protease-4